jgi:soluble P-type ATPase
LAFLLYELGKPLGRAEEYEDIMNTIEQKNEKETTSKAGEKTSALENDQRYVIKLERNLILPVSVMIKTLTELSLPIYISSSGHKCHFMDVCTELTKIALIRDGFMEKETFTKNSMLIEEWKE